LRVPRLLVPALVILAAALGLGAARFLEAPSFTKDYPCEGCGAGYRTAVFVVDGIKCVDTAERAASQLDGLKGVRHYVAYASQNRAEVVYDPDLTGPEAIQKAMEGPVYDAETQTFLYRQFRVVEMNGEGLE
jgi:hypothetical protein